MNIDISVTGNIKELIKNEKQKTAIINMCKAAIIALEESEDE